MRGMSMGMGHGAWAWAWAWAWGMGSGVKLFPGGSHVSRMASWAPLFGVLDARGWAVAAFAALVVLDAASSFALYRALAGGACSAVGMPRGRATSPPALTFALGAVTAALVFLAAQA